MSPEFWAIIGVGIGISSVFGTLFTLLNVRISDLRKDMRDMREDMRDMREDMARMERRINDRIDGVEKNLGARIDAVEARVDGVEIRLRAVEQGQARVIGAVEMMQTIVVATLRGEEVNAD